MIPSGSRPARPMRSGAGSEDFGKALAERPVKSALKARSIVKKGPSMKICAVLFTGALSACGALILSPVLPFYAINSVSATALDIAMMSSVFSFFQMASAPLLGALSDKFGRRPVLLGGLLASAMLYQLQAYADSVPKLLMARGLLGFAGGTIPVEIAYITDLTTKEERPRVLGWQRSLITVGALLGPPIGAIFTGDGFGTLCTVIAGVYLFNFVLGLIFFQERTEVRRLTIASSSSTGDLDEAQRQPSIFSRFQSRTTGLLLFAAFMDCFALAVSDGPEAYFMKEVFGFTEPHLAAFFMVCSASSLICANVVPGILKTVQPKVACVTFSLASAVAMSSLFLFSASWEPYLYAFLSSSAVTVVETVSTTALLSSMVTEDQQGTTYGLESALLNAGFFLGPPLGGYLFDLHHYLPYAVSVGCFCLSAVAYALLPEAATRKEPLLQIEKSPEKKTKLQKAMTRLGDQAPLPNKNFAQRLAVDKARQTWFVDEEMYAPFKEERRQSEARGLRKASTFHVPVSQLRSDDLECSSPLSQR
mmetsp:Transcript_23182/g.53114  ORF Transcript_23182/g.53114 Transcript_23182/m.53114 type:complete len:535 (-) Transcript_23182:192-1796(-)